jgi:uncharacterized protein
MSEIIGLLVTFLPLFVILWIANLAEARRARGQENQGLVVLAYVLVAVVYTIGLLGGLLAQVAAFAIKVAPDTLTLPPTFPSDSLTWVGLGFWLPSLIGLLLLLPAVRRLFARFTALDPQNTVHAVTLSLTMLVVINLMVTLGIGLGNFADLVAQSDTSASVTMISLWVQQILTALLAMIGVGWLTRRNWRETFARLGLTSITGRQLLIGVGIGLGMVPVVLLVEALASQLGVSSDADVERLTEQLLGSLFTSPLGILTIGLSAGLGEETIFRGAMLPRFGLILTALLFALVHSQYGITLSTLVVFLLGLVLGIVRQRQNTTTSMITHAVYNMALGLIAYLSASSLDF